MTNKAIGPTFPAELAAAGVLTLPFSWSADGDISFSPSMTSDQIAAVQAVYAAHDPTKPSWSAYQQSAMAALTESDKTVIRCYENGIALPPAWAEYRKTLRGIVGAQTGDSTVPLPTKPAYPAGT